VDFSATRCTAVEMSTCRQQGRGDLPTTGEQAHSSADLRGGLSSPASTPVMTKMS
jgi:hypothetical protein